MPHEIQGRLTAENRRFGIVVGRFNGFLCEQLLQAALDCLRRHGADEAGMTVVRVPGSFEIPLGVAQLLKTNKFDAIIGLGVLIRGATPHFDYIASSVTRGLGQLSLQSLTPVAYGIITADSIEQAIERAGTKAGNKGWDAAMAAIEMSNLTQEIQKI